MSVETRPGFDFSFDPVACEGCSGNCCIGAPGFTWVGQGEINEISDFLGVQAKDFVRDYTKRVGHRFCLKELSISGSLHCVFFDDHTKQCSIYPVRPAQCRTFPFWDHFKKHPEEALTECPGVVLVRGTEKLQRF